MLRLSDKRSCAVSHSSTEHYGFQEQMETQLDPITDIFRTMHVTAFGQHRLEATAPWGLIQEKQTEKKVTPSGKTSSPTDLAHFAMLSRGNCWLSVEGIPEPIPLTGGDCFLLARDTSIVLRDSPRTRPRWSFREIGAKAKSNVAHYGGGGAPTTIVCGSFSFDRASLRPITQLLPRFILIKAEQARTLALHNTMQALASEMAEQAPGSGVVATRLAEKRNIKLRMRKPLDLNDARTFVAAAQAGTLSGAARDLQVPTSTVKQVVNTSWRNA
jgi:hypothetical protein